MFRTLVIAATVAFIGGGAYASTFTDRSNFISELDTWTEVDTSSFAGLTTLNPSVSFTAGSFFGPDAYIRTGAEAGLIENGVGFYGTTNPHVGINFVGIVNAVGVSSNPRDGGTILLYSGLDGTGSVVGSVGFGHPGGAGPDFGGIVMAGSAKSAVFTCDFDFDLKCGLYDPIFGYKQVAQIPVPASSVLLVGGLGLLIGARRRRRAAV